jgi:hypothetical protein
MAHVEPLVLEVKIKMSLWSAILLRIAGREFFDYVNKLTGVIK